MSPRRFVNPRDRATRHASSQDVAEFLKNDQTLSTGFRTAAHRATVRVLKPVKGGLLLEYTIERAKGKVTVVGPATSLNKEEMSKLIDAIIDFLFKLAKSAGIADCKTTTTTTSTTTTTNGKTTTTVSTTTTTTCTQD